MSQHKLLLGAHMSIAGGFEQAIIRGESIGCTAIQMFTKSNRQWQAKEITQEAIDLFKQTIKSSSISAKNIVVHCAYLINIGSPDHATSRKSIASLSQELERCAMLGIPNLVLHPGSHGGTDVASCLDRIADHLDEVLEKDTGSTHILLE